MSLCENPMRLLAEHSPAFDPDAHWTEHSATMVGQTSLFRQFRSRRQSPHTGREHDFTRLLCPEWVNVVAFTRDGELLLVEQFRHGVDASTLETIGGVCDPGEDPSRAGQRELLEETGYEGENARLLGRIWSNPAILSNKTHTILVENCRLKHEVEWDQGEDLATRLVPVEEVPKLVADEKIGHSLVVVALCYFDLWRRGIKHIGL